jgi:N-acyl-L-homoserine lactone synthetase
VTSDLVFQPPLVLNNNDGDAAKNFPISLRVYSAGSDKTDLYRLRYRAFRDAGWIAENAEQQLSDRFDRLASTFAIGAFHNGECIGSLRLPFGGAGYPAHSLPCEEQFAGEVRALDPGRRQRLVEFSRMAVEPSLTNRSFRTTLYASLVRAGLILTTAAKTDVVVVAVHRRISAFYQAMCGFKVVGKSEGYTGIDEPTNFLALELREAEQRRLRSNAFFAFSEEEVSSARSALEQEKRHAA